MASPDDPPADVRTFAGIPLGAGIGRLYFAVQAIGGVAWWILVLLSDVVRHATLGQLNPVAMAALDIPLFVIASALAATGWRAAGWTTTAWTVLVSIGMVGYATVTTEAGWGALIMLAAAGGSVVACALLVSGRVPTEWLINGPFTFRTAPSASRGRILMLSLLQMLVFWFVFLALIPMVIVFFEARWGLSVDFPAPIRVIGAVLLLGFSVLGVWTAVAMSVYGHGTPLPATMAKRLVIVGPYRYVRNPMALAGIAQGVAVGLTFGSWLVVLYALAGSLIWNWAIRPHEERDLSQRFGTEFDEYRQRVSCWVPTSPSRKSVV